MFNPGGALLQPSYLLTTNVKDQLKHAHMSTLSLQKGLTKGNYQFFDNTKQI